MQYSNRAQVEAIGLAGAESYEDFIGDAPVVISRQLSSYWIVTKQIDVGLAEHHKRDGFWEAWITLWFSKNVKPKSVCIDAGANYGYYTFFLAQHGCRVFAIEANPELIPMLKKSIELNGCDDRVEVFNLAVSDTDGREIVFNTYPCTGDSSLFERPDIAKDGGNFTTTSVTLDELSTGKIDFIKMDIEGSEPFAWKGMQKLLDRNPDCVVLMEFSPTVLSNGGRDFFEEILSSSNISYVDYDGEEKEVVSYPFEHEMDELKMLVLRRKNTSVI